MKRQTLVLIVLFSGILAYAGCFKPPSTDEALLNCSQDIEGQTFANFKDAVKRYGTDRWQVINRDMNSRMVATGKKAGFEDARAIWFPYDSLRLFLCNIEKYSKQIGIGADKLGVRIYYAVYNGDHGDYSNRHTLFMVPTFNSGANDEIRTDFDPRISAREALQKPEKLPDSELAAISLLQIAGSGRTENLLLLGGTQFDISGPGGLIRNSGELCPPKCSPGYTSIFGMIDQ